MVLDVQTARMRELVAALYVVGALVTILGILLAYKRARRDLRLLSKVEVLQESRSDLDLIGNLNLRTEGEHEKAAVEDARRAAELGEVRRALEAAGVPGGSPDFKDMELPLEYWAKRSALRDAVASFRNGGLIALVGVVLSTIASVWSLYLPTT